MKYEEVTTRVYIVTDLKRIPFEHSFELENLSTLPLLELIVILRDV